MARITFRRIKPLARDRQGVAALEFAFVGTLLLMLVLGAYDIGIAVYQRMLLTQALAAGGQYALSYPTPTTNVSSAVVAALPTSLQNAMAKAASSPIVITCPCPAACALPSGCPPVCTDGTDGETFVSLQLTLPTPSFIGTFFAAIPAPSACYVVRVQ